MSYSKLHRHVIHAIEHSTQIVMGICNLSIVFFFFLVDWSGLLWIQKLSRELGAWIGNSTWMGCLFIAGHSTLVCTLVCSQFTYLCVGGNWRTHKKPTITRAQDWSRKEFWADGNVTHFVYQNKIIKKFEWKVYMIMCVCVCETISNLLSITEQAGFVCGYVMLIFVFIVRSYYSMQELSW